MICFLFSIVNKIWVRDLQIIVSCFCIVFYTASQLLGNWGCNNKQHKVIKVVGDVCGVCVSRYFLVTTPQHEGIGGATGQDAADVLFKGVIGQSPQRGASQIHP